MVSEATSEATSEVSSKASEARVGKNRKNKVIEEIMDKSIVDGETTNFSDFSDEDEEVTEILASDSQPKVDPVVVSEVSEVACRLVQDNEKTEKPEGKCVTCEVVAEVVKPVPDHKEAIPPSSVRIGSIRPTTRK